MYDSKTADGKGEPSHIPTHYSFGPFSHPHKARPTQPHPAATQSPHKLFRFINIQRHIIMYHVYFFWANSTPLAMFFLRSPRQASISFSSTASTLPMGRIFSTPSGPSSTLVLKKSMPWSLKRGDSTKVGSTMPFSPWEARSRESAIRAPAMAMERVAEPAPSLALTTSSPPNWTRLTSSSLEDSSGWLLWLKRGTMVTPE